MIITKGILAPQEESDGLRLSIMSRHTLDDGVTPDRRITRDLYKLQKFCFAPPGDLFGRYYRGMVSWEVFEREYLESLKVDWIAERVQGLAFDGLAHNITLLCIEDTPEQCHRRLLAEECQRYQPSLKLDIR
jgi:hypothetical protein